MIRRTVALAGLAIAGLWAASAQAQDIVIPNIVELSGAGATAGTKPRTARAGGQGDQRGRRHPRQEDRAEFVDTRAIPARPGPPPGAIDDRRSRSSGRCSRVRSWSAEADAPRPRCRRSTGGEAGRITAQGNPYIFRTSFAQTTAMPKVARYIATT